MGFKSHLLTEWRRLWHGPEVCCQQHGKDSRLFNVQMYAPCSDLLSVKGRRGKESRSATNSEENGKDSPGPQHLHWHVPSETFQQVIPRLFREGRTSRLSGGLELELRLLSRPDATGGIVTYSVLGEIVQHYLSWGVEGGYLDEVLQCWTSRVPSPQHQGRCYLCPGQGAHLAWTNITCRQT